MQLFDSGNAAFKFLLHVRALLLQRLDAELLNVDLTFGMFCLLIYDFELLPEAAQVEFRMFQRLLELIILHRKAPGCSF